MSKRHGWLLLSLLSFSCHSITAVDSNPQAVAAGEMWDKGQEAMKQGKPEEAFSRYQQSLAVDPAMVRNHLSLATAYLQQGDLGEASGHLAQYVEARPDELIVRARFAELLLRQNRLLDARDEFERFVADAQDFGGFPARHLIHVHRRLMEIALEREDEYAEHLHRGIGLYLLARERETLPDPDEELPVEGLLCRAAAELTLARMERTSEARPCWYLHEVWSHLGQSQPAGRWLREAAAAAPFTYLTPAEQRGLCMAEQQQREERLRN
jgi:tetratricopeptide (TPR) repeat protein